MRISFPRLILSATILISILFCFSCSVVEKFFGQQTDAGRIEIQNESLSTASNHVADTAGVEIRSQDNHTPFVTIPDSTIVSVINVNIDFDHIDEQIIIFKRLNVSNTKLHIAVVDFNDVRDEYIKIWDVATGATKQRFFDLQVVDITGDHRNEIVCKGINDEGLQTIDIFKSFTQRTTPSRTYRSIFTIAVNGNIDVKFQQRSDSYQSGATSEGISFPIQTMVQEGIGEEMKMTSRDYEWSPRGDQYILVGESYTSMEELEKDQLRTFFTKNIEEFELFLDGWWLKNSASHESDQHLIYFSSDEGTVSLFQNDKSGQEASRIQNFFWDDSIHSFYNILNINIVNQNIIYHRPAFKIRVDSLQKITVTIKNAINQTDTNWSGSYTHYPKDSATILLNEMEPQSLPELSGKYDGDDGSSIVFNNPGFKHYQGEQTEAGGYSLYSIDVPIIEMVYMSDNGTIKKRTKFRIDFEEKFSTTEIHRILKLYPGEMSIYGFNEESDNPFYFEQIEQLESTN